MPGSLFPLGIDPAQDGFPKTRKGCAAGIRATRSIFMLDIVMLALGLGFFVAGIGYAYACERL
jgi:hypothetical protein